MDLSYLAQNYPASTIRKLARYAQQFPDVDYFTMGEPDFPSPHLVKETAKEQIDANRTYYGPNIGEPGLQEAIANYYNHHYHSHYQAEQVVVSFGATEACLLTIMATLNPGDEVIIFTPHYPNYLGQVEAMRAKAVLVPLEARYHFQPQIEALEAAITERTKLIIVNTPNNPLGTVIDADKVQAISQVALDHDLFILADEVYHTLTYPQAAHSSFANPDLPNADQTIVVDSFSKSFSMTGYRCGFALCPDPAMAQVMAEFKEGIGFAVPQFIQDACQVALEEGQAATEDMRQAYDQRRQYLIPQLNQIKGIHCADTQGAFYAFADVSEFPFTSWEFVTRLIAEEGLAVIPGSSFGSAGEGFIRISFAASQTKLEKLLAGLRSFSKRHMS
ncbi:aminotransferase class I/II-fold pyridoxal phosphate-dependent enzyme [Aerococcus sp. UMB7834]|uniref:pyridoxal phosphate-dependent aminotransferase n=1 Tax=Aerococcus sp. UMB7834 TaxID=3046342 RepID=UPI00254EF65B|nr:aminotransferase class I/II-fold pyridoxal phosphate-dependent enzyme [Aerococcus sp. UMB7834]MDK6804875.1 aminotransferase class I/II-fold pyridoxal phosphate-dependent enzyme [Aerococcus sp. UMB7834]